MTTTKLGSTQTASKMPAVSRSTTPTTTPTATAAVAKALGVAPSPETSQAVTFDAAAQAKVGLNPTGEHVATSADPGALWGAEKRQPVNTELRAAMTEFRKLSPDAQQAKIAELKTKQDDLSKKMLVRIDQLDDRYKTMLNTSKGEMLRNLSNKTDAMSPAEKQHLDGLLNKADGIAKEIEGLKAKAATLPDSKVATPEQKAERTEMARLIKNARSRLSTATKAATTYVDSLGLKAERVAVNEQKIDPTAPPPSSPSSLLSKIGEWFGLNKLITFFKSTFTEMNPLMSVGASFETKLERKQQERTAEVQSRVERQRETDARAQLARDGRGQLELEADSRRAQLDALNLALAGVPRPSRR
ncbi:MAG: hypothetical protein Q8L14_08085 [Myxococcales bacterium]|nr:hypothetical protein [Myxococcales bacterium]